MMTDDAAKTLAAPFYNTHVSGFVFADEKVTTPPNVSVQPRKETSVNFVHNRVGNSMAYQRDAGGQFCKNSVEHGGPSRNQQFNSVNSLSLSTPYGMGRTATACATHQHKNEALKIDVGTRGRMTLQGGVPKNSTGTLSPKGAKNAQ